MDVYLKYTNKSAFYVFLFNKLPHPVSTQPTQNAECCVTMTCFKIEVLRLKYVYPSTLMKGPTTYGLNWSTVAAAASTQITFSKGLHSADSGQSALLQLVCSHGKEKQSKLSWKRCSVQSRGLEDINHQNSGAVSEFFVWYDMMWNSDYSVGSTLASAVC